MDSIRKVGFFLLSPQTFNGELRASGVIDSVPCAARLTVVDPDQSAAVIDHPLVPQLMAHFLDF